MLDKQHLHSAALEKVGEGILEKSVEKSGIDPVKSLCPVALCTCSEEFNRRVCINCKPNTFQILLGLQRAFKMLCASPQVAALCKAAFFCYFWGSLYLGETLSFLKDDSSGKALQVSNISFTLSGISRRLQMYKTDQSGF